MASTLKVNTIQHSGGTTALTMDSTGRILTPARPAFRAQKTSSQTATGNNELVTWDTVGINTGNHFGSNVFTAPIAGLYTFSVIVLTPNSTALETYDLMFTPSGGSLTTLAKFMSTGAANHETVSGTMIHEMGVGDTMGFYLASTNDAIYGASDRWSTWCGYLLG